MCLAIPGKVEEIITEGDLRIGRVNFGGYTIVHVGFALSKIDEETALKTLEDFRAMGMLDEELGSEDEAFARAALAPSSPCPAGSCSVVSYKTTG